MKRIRDKEWALSIAPETVREVVRQARAISSGVRNDYNDGAEHEVEVDGRGRPAHHHDGLAEEEAHDPSTGQLRRIIRDMNEDEAAELVALMWIGRGDFESYEFAEAVEEAKLRRDIRPARYLLDRPMLGEWLEEGLQAIGA